MLLWLWLIGIVILGVIAAFQLGKVEDNVIEDIFWVVVIGVVLWPLLLLSAVIVAPFGIPFYYGRKIKEKRDQEAKEAKKNKV